MSFWPFSNPLALHSRLQKFLDDHALPLAVLALELVADRELAREIVYELHQIKGNFSELAAGFVFTNDPGSLAASVATNSAASHHEGDGGDKEPSQTKGVKLLEIIVQPQVLDGLLDYLVRSVKLFEDERRREDEVLQKLIRELPDKTKVAMSDKEIRGELDQQIEVTEEVLLGEAETDDHIPISTHKPTRKPPPGTKDPLPVSKASELADMFEESVTRELSPDFLDDPLDKVARDPLVCKNDDDDEHGEETAQEKFIRELQTALDILSTDIWIILNRIIETPAMEKLWLILLMPGLHELLPTVNHVVHILDQLMDANLIELLNFIRRQPDLVDTFVSNIDIPVIMDYFLRVIQTDKPDLPTGIVQSLLAQGLIPKLVDILKPDPEWFSQNPPLAFVPNPDHYFRQLSATDFLKALITISSNTALAVTLETNIGPNQLTRELVLPPIIKTMVEEVMLYQPPQKIPGWTNKPGFINCVGIIIEVIRKNNLDYDLNCGPYSVALDHLDDANGTTGEVNALVMFKWLKDFEENPPGPRDPIYLGGMLEILCGYLDTFSAIIEQPAAEGDEDTQLGYTKFKISELIAELLHCLNMILLNLRRFQEIMRVRDHVRAHQDHRLAYALNDLLPAAVNKMLVDLDLEDEVLLSVLWDDDDVRREIDRIDHDYDLEDEEPLISAENPFVGPQRDAAMRKHPCIGDYFKMKLIDLNILINITNKFTEYPWHNFFHNVVFDLIQQIFNGKLNLYNLFLIVELFKRERGHLVQMIVDLYQHHHDDEFRPGYMGHLILIAEEVVKFTNLYKPDLISPVIVEAVTLDKWEWFVDNVLLKTREVYNVVLGADADDTRSETDADYALEEDKANHVILLSDPLNHDEFVHDTSPEVAPAPTNLPSNENNDHADDTTKSPPPSEDQLLDEELQGIEKAHPSLDQLLTVDPTSDELSPQSPEEELDEQEEVKEDEDAGSDDDHELRRVPRHV